MLKERSEAQERLRELNKRFLEEIESGRGWEDVHGIMEEMKEIAKSLDHLPAQIVNFDNYPLKNTGQLGT